MDLTILKKELKNGMNLIMDELPRSKFSSRQWASLTYPRQKKYQHIKRTSFSVLKHIEYNNAQDAQIHSERLLKLKNDKFEGRIRVPYFEFEVKESTMIIQSEYIKGRPPIKHDMKHIYDVLVCRSNAWTFLDCYPTNFVVDTSHRDDKTNSAPIYVIDIDSYKEIDIETRKKRYKEAMHVFGGYWITFRPNI